MSLNLKWHPDNAISLILGNKLSEYNLSQQNSAGKKNNPSRA